VTWTCDDEEVGVPFRLGSDRAGDLWEEGRGEEMLGVVSEDGLGDGWEDNASGDGRAVTCGASCSGTIDERMDVAEEDRRGVATGVVMPAETTGTAPVVFVREERPALPCS